MAKSRGIGHLPVVSVKAVLVNAAPGCLALLITQYSGKALALRIKAKPSAVLNLIMESILRASPTVSPFRHQTKQTVHTNLWIALWISLEQAM